MSPGRKPRHRAAARPVEPPPEPDPLDPVGSLPVRGRVLDPDGQPIAGAAIHVCGITTEHGWDPSDPVTHGQRGRVAVSEPDGRFHFDLDKVVERLALQDEPAWHEAKIAAVAPGLRAGLDRRRIAAQGRRGDAPSSSATTCRSAAAWSTRRAGPCPG